MGHLTSSGEPRVVHGPTAGNTPLPSHPPARGIDANRAPVMDRGPSAGVPHPRRPGRQREQLNGKVFTLSVGDNCIPRRQMWEVQDTREPVRSPKAVPRVAILPEASLPAAC